MTAHFSRRFILVMAIITLPTFNSCADMRGEVPSTISGATMTLKIQYETKSASSTYTVASSGGNRLRVDLSASNGYSLSQEISFKDQMPQVAVALLSEITQVWLQSMTMIQPVLGEDTTKNEDFASYTFTLSDGNQDFILKIQGLSVKLKSILSKSKYISNFLDEISQDSPKMYRFNFSPSGENRAILKEKNAK